MRVDIVTLFPELIEPYFSGGLLGAARERGVLEVHLHQLRDYTRDNHRQVDDRPYGGGPGMVLKPEPFFRVVESLEAHIGQRPRVLLTSARGKVFNQAKARELSDERCVTILCGRYQGVDDRVKTLVDDELSIGDFVLSGGELPALVVAESIGRLVPGVVGNLDSLEADSFAESDLLGPPQYTRPSEFRGMQVPEVLLSGDHAEIERWRREQALATTRRNRPDLLDPSDRLPDVD